MNPFSAAEAGKAHAPYKGLSWALVTLSFQTLGIIYSDIGTSPLYTLNGLWPANGPVPPTEDVIGGISAIIWALTLLPLCKYVFICLRFGTTEGEGGTFALYQGLFPPELDYTDDDSLLAPADEKASELSADVHAARAPQSTVPQRLRWPLFVWCLFGTALTLADGVFTPAVSVTSAVAGIAVAKESVTNDVTPISIVLLLVLFLAQFRGTSQLGFLFAPVTLIWLILLAVTGIINIVAYPGIFRAFDPSRAILLFVRTRDYDILAGVLLALTGCEAMFASLGHFNILSIQLSFTLFVYPSIVLAYLGQGARLIRDGEAVLSNLFYATIPGRVNGPVYWIMFVFGILATFIASQTLITAAFSLIQQMIKNHVLPPLRVVHTSSKIKGQIYIPAVNWLLMIVTIVVVGTFRNSTSLSNAYGFSVATVMFSTTVLIAIQMVYVKHLPIYVALAFFLVFGFLDGLFWGAALKKIPQGAYVPLIIGSICMLIMVFWSWAKGLEDAFDGNHRSDLQNVIIREQLHTSDADYDAPEVSYVQREGGPVSDSSSESEKYYICDPEERIISAILPSKEYSALLQLARLPTCAVFHRMTSGKGVPHSFAAFVRQWPALPRVVIFLSVHVMSVAEVEPEERYTLRKVPAVRGFYVVIYRIGYRETFNVKVEAFIDKICDLEAREDPVNSAATIAEVRTAARRVTHIAPHYVVTSRSLGSSRFMRAMSWMRAVLLEDIYRRLATMFPDTDGWRGSADEIIHVGVNATL
ncbi:KUP/HAK/KT family potassium transporter [Phanerochaete sordida]|uniref:KUP/HAK/KT family potassium transporter n=1 Tax=Phanerochaete sordida TaxID=48140 RepID=A0A9P3FZI5_9APHY|nr:KUP/HAK/KT family potassium transporter [Phanerochaete sordida]